MKMRKFQLVASVWISVPWLCLKLMEITPAEPRALQVSTATISGASNHCLRERTWHPVPARDINIRGKGKHSYPDFASVRILCDILSWRVNHHVPRKNVSHLKNSSTVKEIQGKTFGDKCVREQVPKKLHWIWFGTELPDKYASNIEESSMKNPGWEIFLWSELPSQKLEERLHKHGVQYNFKNITGFLEAGLFVNGDLIQSEKNLAGKSDYLRLEIVYMEGGIYQDTDAHAVQGFDNFGDLFRWPFGVYNPTGYHAGTVANTVFGYAEGSGFLLFALNLTRENCLTFKRCGVMTGAGPDFLTAALYYFDDPDIVLLHKDYLLVQTMKSVTYQTNDATWVAAHKVNNGGHW